MLSGVAEQLAAELPRQQDDPYLALERYLRPALLRSLHGDIAQLADPYPRGAEGLHQQLQPLEAPLMRCAEQALVIRARQLPPRLPEHPPLHPQRPGPAVLPAQEAEQPVHRRQHGVHRRRGVARLHQVRLPAGRRLRRDRPAAQPAGERAYVPQVLLDRAGAALPEAQVPAICRDLRGRHPLSHILRPPSAV